MCRSWWDVATNPAPAKMLAKELRPLLQNPGERNGRLADEEWLGGILMYLQSLVILLFIHRAPPLSVEFRLRDAAKIPKPFGKPLVVVRDLGPLL